MILVALLGVVLPFIFMARQKGLFIRPVYLKGVSVPEQAKSLVEQGWNLEKKDRIEEARRYYKQALKVDPRCNVAYKHLGTSYTRMGAFEQAGVEYDKAVELGPTYASSYYNRGLLYHYQGNYDKAIADYSKALELQPGYTNPLMNRAAMYVAKGDQAAALADYDAYLAIVPSNQEVVRARKSVSEAPAPEADGPASTKSNNVLLGAPGRADTLDLPVATVRFLPPSGWAKKSDVLMKGFAKALVEYQKVEGNEFPSIAVAAQRLPADLNTVEKYVAWVGESSGYGWMISRVRFGEPKQERVAAGPATYVEFTGEGLEHLEFRFAWYLLEFNGQLLTFQYANTDYQFQKDLPLFKRFVQSLAVELKNERAVAAK